MKWISTILVLLIFGCSASPDKGMDLRAQCSEATHTLKVAEGQSFEEAFRESQDEYIANLNTRWSEARANIDEMTDPLVLGIVDALEESVCLSVLGLEPSSAIIKIFESKGIDLTECDPTSYSVSIIGAEYLEEHGVYAVTVKKGEGCEKSVCMSERVYSLECFDGQCSKTSEQLCWAF